MQKLKPDEVRIKFDNGIEEIYKTYWIDHLRENNAKFKIIEYGDSTMEEKKFLKELFEGKVEIINKKVSGHGTSGAVYLPKKLVGKSVTILIKEENSDEPKEILVTTEEKASEDVVTT